MDELQLRRMMSAVSSLQAGYLVSVPKLPDPGPQYQGQLLLVPGGDGVADAIKVCRKKANGTWEWVDIPDHKHTGADGDGPVINAVNGPLTVQGQVTCQGVKLAAGTQETGRVDLSFVATAAAQSVYGGVGFRAEMINTPSSITLTPGNKTNMSAGPTFSAVTKYGFRFFITAAAAGVCHYLDGQYTTVGN